MDDLSDTVLYQHACEVHAPHVLVSAEAVPAPGGPGTRFVVRLPAVAG